MTSRKKKSSDEVESGSATDELQPAAATATSEILLSQEVNTKPARRQGFELPRHWPATLLVLVVAAFLVGGLAAYWPQFSGDDADARIAALEEQISQLTAGPGATAPQAAAGGNQNNLQTRVESVETRLGTLERNAPTIFNPQAGATLDGRVTGLEQSRAETTQALSALIARMNSIEAATPTDLPQRLQSFALGTDLAQVDARVRQLEALRQAAGVLALARLARAADEARTYRRELSALQAVAPGDPSIAVLEPHAEDGVPTAAMLAARFPDAARVAISSERMALADGFWSRLWARFRNLVSVRRIVMAPGDDSESRLARAQVALGRGDLQNAVEEAGALNGEAATAIGPWLTQARARIAIERAIADMDERLTQILAAPPSNVTPAQAAPASPAPDDGARERAGQAARSGGNAVPLPARPGATTP